MIVLVLGKIDSPVTPIIRDSGCEIIEQVSPVSLEFFKKIKTDFVISYGYRFMIRKPLIEYVKRKIINLHISLLPWNRGADPNLWSFLENTPKGVTIHYVNEGLDTGDIIAQKELFFDEERETLATTYKKLNDEIANLFEKYWPNIMLGKVQRRKQPPYGSFHLLKDRKKFEHLLLKKGWATPVRELVGKAL
jgi:methionyl-tRNA formyltransferase